MTCNERKTFTIIVGCTVLLCAFICSVLLLILLILSVQILENTKKNTRAAQVYNHTNNIERQGDTTQPYNQPIISGCGFL